MVCSQTKDSIVCRGPFVRGIFYTIVQQVHYEWTYTLNFYLLTYNDIHNDR